MTAARLRVAICLLAIATLRVPGAAAQTPARQGVRPTLTAATVFDDNVFLQPAAVADAIVRMTPGLVLVQQNPHVNFSANYSFDSELYQNRKELTTIQARQAALFTSDFRMGPKTSLSATGGYTSTTNPSELNTLTELNVGRVRATSWQAGTMLRRGVSRHLDAVFGYDFARTGLERGAPTVTHSVDARLSYRRAARSLMFVRLNARHFDFGVVTSPPIMTTLVSGGWTKSGKSMHATAEVGLQSIQGSLSNTADVSVGRIFGQTDITGGYGRGVTSAAGVASTVSFDHVQLGVTYQPRTRSKTGALQLGARVGGTRNQVLSGELRTYLVGVDLTKPLTRTLVFRASYEGSRQKSIVRIPGLLGGDINRNRLTLNVSFSPWSLR